MPSTAIRRIHYDPAERRLDVEFMSGAIYEYFGVPERLYEEFVSAPSRGRFFAYRFRDKFSYRRRQGPTQPRLH